jgi:hypothetical protein
VLGIGARTLYRKLEKYQGEGEKGREGEGESDGES